MSRIEEEYFFRDVLYCEIEIIDYSDNAFQTYHIKCMSKDCDNKHVEVKRIDNVKMIQYLKCNGWDFIAGKGFCCDECVEKSKKENENVPKI